MARPSFQFYPKDWRNNANLRRCSPAARGIWVDVLCVLHDSDEYGIVRWPLKELSNAANAPMSLMRELVQKSVLKGAEKNEIAPVCVYTPRSGRQEGTQVTLLVAQQGPIWFSSRMIKDEHVRSVAGASTRFGAAENKGSLPITPPSTTPITPPASLLAPSQRHGERRGMTQGDGSSSSSSSPVLIPNTIYPPKGVSNSFQEFWKAWPKNERKQDKAKCEKKWQALKLDEDCCDAILADIQVKLTTEKWRSGFIEAPLVYLSNRRWEDGVEASTETDVNAWMRNAE